METSQQIELIYTIVIVLIIFHQIMFCKREVKEKQHDANS